MYNILIFLQKLLTYFSKKFRHICVTLDINFNKLLTNDIVSFQLGPIYLEMMMIMMIMMIKDKDDDDNDYV